MRIISKFKDYYDGVQSFGDDASMIYSRKTELVDTPIENEIDRFLHEHANYDSVKAIRSESGVEGHLFICKVILGFCGELITCYGALWPKEDLFESPVFFFNKEEMIKFLRQHEKSLYMEDIKFRSPIDWKKKKAMHWQEFIPEFEIFQGRHDKIFHALKKPIFIYPRFVFDYDFIKDNIWLREVQQNRSKIIVDPMLKNIGFQRIKNAFQCYQSIDQYLNGVLGNTEKDDDNRSDLEKVRSHGFDEKYGFRTRRKE